ncbi:MAG: HAMP domain-containing histidine kinase [Candidatus Eremiobacteraeota bacterium]|nr:HAMP domain-containing histidine kinase [Candidatus Eremiobacteraeota bacterium]
MSLASRLATLYSVMLAVIVTLVIGASSLALVYALQGVERDVVIAKRSEARSLAEQYRAQGLTLIQAAPLMVKQLGGIGLRIAVFNQSGKYVAGDRELSLPAAHHRGPPPLNRMLLHVILSSGPRNTHYPEHPGFTPVRGGFVAFAPTSSLLVVTLAPYWKLISTIALVAIFLAWLLGRYFAKQALRPLNEVTGALRELARGDYAERRFMMKGGDEIASLTCAYNDATAQVVRAMEERSRTEQRMRQFVADAGHELRTPLTVISGYIDVLRRGAIAEPNLASTILATMSLEKEHMRNLVDRLMRLARLEGDGAPNTEAIDLSDMLASQAEAARRLNPKHEIDYRVDGDLTVAADRTELSEALSNIVENAVKYAPNSPVELRGYRQNGSTVIEVSDFGPGMSEMEKIHAFERFFRGDVRGEITGSGLGLAIAKRAVERAGGTIDISSTVGKGTTVSIRL